MKPLLEQSYTSELILRLTALALILHGWSTEWLEAILVITCGVALISPSQWLRHPLLWMLIMIEVWWMNAPDWQWIDNHQYLISYWVLVCVIATRRDDPMPVFRWNGRILIGLAFALAFVWKVSLGEYWDGDFIRYEMLMDSRFERLAHFIGGVPLETLLEAKLIENEAILSPGTSFELPPVTERLDLFAKALSWWTLAIEAIIAAAYLLGRRWQVIGSWGLMLFIVSTYICVPVLGFGAILGILGLAATPVDSTKTRAAWLVVLAIVQVGRLV